MPFRINAALAVSAAIEPDCDLPTEKSDLNRLSEVARTVWGIQPAVQGVIRALLQCSRQSDLDVFCQPHRLDEIEASLSVLGTLGRIAAPVRVRNVRELASQPGAPAPDIWFETAPRFALASYLRSLAAANFPVTALTHSLSYHTFPNETLMPLLLSGSEPYDALVCTSSAAKTALGNLLDDVSGQLEAGLGIEAKYRGRLEIVPLGVDTDRFRPRDKACVREQLGLNAEDLIILYAGRLSFSDKADLIPLLHVYRELLRENPQSPLRFVVAGSELWKSRTELREAAAQFGIGDRLTVCGLPEHIKPLLYSAADVFVSPADNIQESFGLTNIEAMASGIPQVVSDWSGYRETVRHGETGFLIPTIWDRCDADLRRNAPLSSGDWHYDHACLSQSVVVDLSEYTRSLSCLIANPALRHEMAAKSRARAVSDFSWEVMTARYEELWLELVGQSATSSGCTHPGFMLKPAYSDAFGHFATRSLNGATKLVITESGAAALTEPKAVVYPRQAVRWRLLGESLIADSLRIVATHSHSGDAGIRRGRLSVASLEEQLAQTHPDHHPASLRRHVLWLLKQGFLAEQPRSAPAGNL